MYVQSIELYFILKFSYLFLAYFILKTTIVCNIITYLGNMGITDISRTSNKLNC
jgi:hypothetical protein